MLTRREWLQVDIALDAMGCISLAVSGSGPVAHVPVTNVKCLIMAFVEGAVKKGATMTLPGRDELSEAVLKDADDAAEKEIREGRSLSAIGAFWTAVEKGAGRAPTWDEIENTIAIVLTNANPAPCPPKALV